MSSLSTVVRGNIKSVVADDNLQAAVIKVSATRVFRQKYVLFTGNSRLGSRGEIRTLLQCGVKPGPGSFLFTGRVHFGEAWLGCAPRYKDFQRAYTMAKAAQQIPCELPVDWAVKPEPNRLQLGVEAAPEGETKLGPCFGRSHSWKCEPMCLLPSFQRTEKWHGLFPCPFQCNMQATGQKRPVRPARRGGGVTEMQTTRSWPRTATPLWSFRENLLKSFWEKWSVTIQSGLLSVSVWNSGKTSERSTEKLTASGTLCGVNVWWWESDVKLVTPASGSSTVLLRRLSWKVLQNEIY